MSTTTGLRQGDVGYAMLWTPDVARAAAFYHRLLGWRLSPGGSAQGRQVEGVTPPFGVWGGQERYTLFLCYAVDDVAEAIHRVRAAGGRAEESRREPYGMIADCEDDQGLPFVVYEDAGGGRATKRPRHGELAYITIGFPDVEAAKAFYGSVLGWRFTPGRVENGWNVHHDDSEVRPMTGFWGGRERAAAVPLYAVDDLAVTVAKARELGGTATDPEPRPFGSMAECTDDQGCPFYLAQLAG